MMSSWRSRTQPTPPNRTQRAQRPRSTLLSQRCSIRIAVATREAPQRRQLHRRDVIVRQPLPAAAAPCAHTPRGLSGSTAVTSGAANGAAVGTMARCRLSSAPWFDAATRCQHFRARHAGPPAAHCSAALQQRRGMLTTRQLLPCRSNGGAVTCAACLRCLPVRSLPGAARTLLRCVEAQRLTHLPAPQTTRCSLPAAP